jgi:hypothetical protein
MPGELSSEGTREESGKTRPSTSQSEKQNTVLLEFDPSKIIGKP